MYVITGGGTGIGAALAVQLAKRGCRVLIIGRRLPFLQKVASHSSQIDYHSADVATIKGQSSIIRRLRTESSIAAMVHNAGVITPIQPLLSVKRYAWRNVIATNLEAPLFLTQALQKQLSEGRVLHIGSGAAYLPIQAWGGYCVSKAGLSMLTQCLQLESNTIAFSSVMPGIVDTAMQAQIRDASDMASDKHDFFVQLKQTSRLLSVETVALFLSWLLLDISKRLFSSKEWDIYDTTHHTSWLIPPHTVPVWSEEGEML